MHLGQKELYKPIKEQQDKNKDNRLKSEPKRLLNLKLQELNNKCKNKKCSNNKQELKKHNLSQQLESKDKLENLNKNSNNKENNC